VLAWFDAEWDGSAQTWLVVWPPLLLPPPRPQVKQLTMIPKKEAMALMMALSIPAMPLTTAMMQAPIVWNKDLMHDTTAPISKMLRCAAL